MLRHTLALILLAGTACSFDREFEGDEPGECTDGADNDRDGDFDCDDKDCIGGPDCPEVDTSERIDADTDVDADTDTDTDVWEPPPGEMEYSPETILFEDVVVGIAVSTTLRIDSVGNQNLQVESIDVSDDGEGVFSVTEGGPWLLPPGTSLEVAVVASLSNPAESEGALTVNCDDLETCPASVLLQAVPAEMK